MTLILPVLQVTELNAPRSAMINEEGDREYVRVFDVVSSRGDTSGAVILNLASGLPRRGDFFVSRDGFIDLGAWVRSVDVKLVDESTNSFQVTVKYSSKLKNPEQKEIENPLLKPAIIEWGSVKVRKPLTEDRQFEPLLNSAYRPFEPPPEIEEVRMLLTITRNQVLYDAVGYTDYIGSINSDRWFGFIAETARCMSIDGTREYDKGIYFWKTKFQFEILEGGGNVLFQKFYQLKILDAGYEEYDILTDTWSHITDRGRPISTPALLDGAGQRLANPTPKTAVYLKFDVYRKLDFNLLRLP